MQKFILPLTTFLLALFLSANSQINQIRWGSTGDPLNGLTISWTNTGTGDSIQFYNAANKTWGAQKTFATAPPVNTDVFNFLAIGDSRNGLQVWKTVSDLANAKKAALTVFNGDIVDNGGADSEWDAWFNSGATYIENNLIYHAMGNHEEDNVDTKKYFENIFELPKNSSGSELYSATKYGNVLFVTLNSEVYGSSGSPSAQASWLDAELKKAKNDPSILWTVISHHRPQLNIGEHTNYYIV